MTNNINKFNNIRYFQIVLHHKSLLFELNIYSIVLLSIHLNKKQSYLNIIHFTSS